MERSSVPHQFSKWFLEKIALYVQACLINFITFIVTCKDCKFNFLWERKRYVEFPTCVRYPSLAITPLRGAWVQSCDSVVNEHRQSSVVVGHFFADLIYRTHEPNHSCTSIHCQIYLAPQEHVACNPGITFLHFPQRV